jgi:carbamoyl-phosphate synthase large subunit
MDLAEDRDRFNALMGDLDVAQPEGGAARSREEAFELANDVGYPVLVRPSYVLGGRAMEVVYDDAEFGQYIEEAVRTARPCSSAASWSTSRPRASTPATPRA